MSNNHSEQPHIIGVPVYLFVFLSLIVLTGVTVVISSVNLGDWNVVMAFAVASVKATLVLGYFMHLKYDNRLFKYLVVVAIITLLIIFGLTFLDYSTR